MKRELLLDNLRALVMIHIVCVIHVLYWFRLGNEFLHSVLLFEMPAIFFIAGAAQSLSSKPKTLKYTIISKTKRILIPFYIFLAILYFWMSIMSYFKPYIYGIEVNLFSLSKRDIIKTLITGGCDQIPFYGYTWFISTYLLVSISLPFQRKLLKHNNRNLYILYWMLIVLGASFVTIPFGNREVKNLIIYNLFYMIGFVYYKNIPKKMLWMVTIIATIITLYGFTTSTILPMQDHKFPADYLFMIFGIAWIGIFSILLEYIHIPNSKLLQIWNKNGYYFYLYQTITFSMIVGITYLWINRISSDCIKFIIYTLLCLSINTLFGYCIQRFIIHQK